MIWNRDIVLRSISFCAIFFGLMYSIATCRNEMTPLGMEYEIDFSDVGFWLITVARLIIYYVAIILMQRLSRIRFNLGYRIDVMLIIVTMLLYIYFNDECLLLPLALIAGGAVIDSVNVYLNKHSQLNE